MVTVDGKSGIQTTRQVCFTGKESFSSDDYVKFVSKEDIKMEFAPPQTWLYYVQYCRPYTQLISSCWPVGRLEAVAVRIQQ